MPGGKKKKAKGGGKKKKKSAKAAVDIEVQLKKCQALLKAYQQSCTFPDKICSLEIIKLLREGIQNEKPLVKFFLDGAAIEQKAEISTSPDLPSPTSKVLQPLVDSWVATRYNYVGCLYIWNLSLDDDAIVSLALYFESPVGCAMKALEIREGGLSPWAIGRLARSLSKAQLLSLNLDYNRVPQDTLVQLCEGLRFCPTIQSLSLNFCEIDLHCGEVLGTYVATSCVRELSLIGNALTSCGCSELIKPLVALCSAPEGTLTPAPDPVSSDKTEGDTTPELVLKPPPPPALAKLFLQDNSIDLHSPCPKKSFDSVLCTREIKRLLVSSPILEELQLDGNAIGDGGAREVLEGLTKRKEGGLPVVRVGITSSVSPDLFAAINELTSVKPTKKKGKKKGKKKK